MAPSPRFQHQEILGELFAELRNFLAANPIGKVSSAPLDVYLDNENVVQPDLLFVCKERLAIIEDYVKGAPDLVVEILPPSTSERDRGPKRALYAQHGVKEFWLVSPEAASVHIYRFAERDDRPVEMLTGADALTSPLLPGFSIAVESIFART